MLSLMAIGTLVLSTTVFRLWQPGDFSGSLTWDLYLVYVVPLLAFLLGRVLRRRGRLHFATIISSSDDLGTRPFVLYLRSFEDDPELARSPFQPVHPPVFHLQLLISGRTEEEQLAAAVKRMGPLVAIGAPGDRHPYSGATRMYLPSENWKDTVRELMVKARLVILALGPGDGTMWELVEAMHILPPERLVLLVPMAADAYDQFKEQATAELRDRATRLLHDNDEVWSPPSLPEYTYNGGNPFFTTMNIKGAICFSPRWVPAFIDLSLPGSRLWPAIIAPYCDIGRLSLKIGLRPALRQVTWYEQRLTTTSVPAVETTNDAPCPEPRSETRRRGRRERRASRHR